MAGRTIVIGDVHGCTAEVHDLFAAVQLTPADRVIFVGDLVDRGPDPAGAVALAMQHESVQGNHESALVERGPRGVIKHPDHQRTWSLLSETQREWIATRPTYIQLPEFNTVVVHAGAVPEVPWADQPKQILQRGQAIMPPSNPHGYWTPDAQTWWLSKAPPGAVFWAQAWTGPERVVFGHTVFSQPYLTDLVAGIDTGVVFGRSLTALVLPDWRVVSVPARQQHYRHRTPSHRIGDVEVFG